MIVNVKHLKSHILETAFSDKTSQIIDFAPFIFSSGHPDLEKYQKESDFLTYDIIDGNLNWDDYTMIFPIEDLHKGHLIKPSTTYSFKKYDPNQ